MATAANFKTEEAKAELIQLVSFNLDREEYGVYVLKVREIIRMSNVTRVPNTPYYVEGVINLRGKVIPIISLRKKFSLPEVENDKQTRIIVMDVDGELMGFIVDAVSEVIRISSAEIQPPPAVVNGGLEQEYLSGVINRADRLLVLLDLERVFSKAERDSLINAAA
ncbi:MAG: chemotaxis protein CheW [Geobacteraceae bacterium]|nr:chemotaxis protein CheW [Geobacteraceae bacterium]